MTLLWGHGTAHGAPGVLVCVGTEALEWRAQEPVPDAAGEQWLVCGRCGAAVRRSDLRLSLDERAGVPGSE